MKRLILTATVFAAIALGAGAAVAQQFTYKPAGDLQSGTAGRPTSRIWIPKMRFPVLRSPAYANSQVWGHGGSQGPGGSQCDGANYSYPWHDNYCEPRRWDMPLCPGGDGHQGQDIRPRTCDDAEHWAVAAEAGTIIDDSGTAIKLKTSSGRVHRYLHMELSTLVVDVGDRVDAGDKIGKISDYTGGEYPTTIHLHYDVRQYVASDPKSGASVGEVAYIPPYPSLVDSYKRLIGQDDGQYEASLEVRFLDGKDRYKGGSSKGVPDYFPGETVRAALYLKNAGDAPWPTESFIGYAFQSPFLSPTSYRIDSDHPEHDQSSWERNSADGADANPGRGDLGASGKLHMHAFSSGETKRVTVEMTAGPYSIGRIDHPDVRSWIWSVDGVYGPQAGFRKEPGSNGFGSRIRDYAQMDVLSRDHWHFAGGEESAKEGWSGRDETEELLCNVQHEALAQKITGPDAQLISPKWTSVDADEWDQLVLRMRAHDGPHQIAIFWRGEGEAFSESRKVQFEAKGDSKWRTYVVPIGEHHDWNGTVDRLRVDQLQGAAPPEGESWYDLGDLFFQSASRSETNSQRVEFVSDDPVSISGVEGGGAGDAGGGGSVERDTWAKTDGSTRDRDVGVSSDAGIDRETSAANASDSESTTASCSSAGSGGRAPVGAVVLAILGAAAGVRRRA